MAHPQLFVLFVISAIGQSYTNITHTHIYILLLLLLLYPPRFHRPDTTCLLLLLTLPKFTNWILGENHGTVLRRTMVRYCEVRCSKSRYCYFLCWQRNNGDDATKFLVVVE